MFVPLERGCREATGGDKIAKYKTKSIPPPFAPASGGQIISNM